MEVMNRTLIKKAQPKTNDRLAIFPKGLNNMQLNLSIQEKRSVLS
jgi:hypothetical protein